MSVSNKQNKTHYTRSEVRESIAAEIKSLAGYDDRCIDEDLPESLGKAGPWKVLLAAAAAKAMIDAEGVTIVAYDSNMGTRDPMDFEVELRLPSGSAYDVPRTEKPSYPPKERDNSRRISCFIYVPRNASGRYKEEETALRRCASRKWPTHTSTNMVEWESASFDPEIQRVGGARASSRCLSTTHRTSSAARLFAKRSAISSGSTQEWENLSRSA